MNDHWIFFVVVLICIYYLHIFAELFSIYYCEYMKTKLDFILALIPFFYWARIFILNLIKGFKYLD